MKKITKTYTINAPTDKVWECLTSDKMMKSWGAAPAKFKLELGAEFKMWGGYLRGEVTRIEAPNLLEQDWVVDGMDEPSKALFTLEQTVNGTELILTHSNIPDDLADELDQGWDEHYLGPIKDFLE